MNPPRRPKPSAPRPLSHGRPPLGPRATGAPDQAPRAHGEVRGGVHGGGWAGPQPLQEAELAELDELLAQVPAPLQPLDLTALDGFLAGVLLQPQRVPPSRWLPFITDEEGRPLPASWPPRARLQALVQQRFEELNALIEGRQWFDPWITDVDENTLPQEAAQPWVLGFATACGEFPALTEGPGSDEPELIEALAQLYQHLDPADLEDADALLEEIDTLEPPASMEEAVESLVRGCLLLADVSRPVRRSPAAHPSRRAEQGARRSAGSASTPHGPSGTRPRKNGGPGQR